MAVYTIKGITPQAPWEPEPGKSIPVNLCTVADASGTTEDAQIYGGQSWTVGQQVVGEMKRNPKGTTLKVDKDATQALTSGTVSSGIPGDNGGLPEAGANGFPPPQTQPAPSTQQPNSGVHVQADTRERRIVHQHSQSVAVALHRLEVEKGAQPSPERVEELAKQFDAQVFAV